MSADLVQIVLVGGPLDGETVAALCPDCGEQLGAEYVPKEQP